MTDTNVYITKLFIDNNHSLSSEQDFVLQDAFKFKYNDEGTNELITILGNRDEGRADAFPVEIDSLIAGLVKLKNKGANYVEMEYHCDHIGYDISGYQIRPPTPEEVLTYREKHDKARLKQERINDLRKQIDALDRED